MVLQAPITRELHVALREAVAELRARERRRHFPVTVRMGVAGGPSWEVVEPADEHVDHGLRTDVAAALLHRCRVSGVAGAAGAPVLAWVTRPGDLAVQDPDLAWAGAVRAALAEAGAVGDFVVVTHHGWRDPVSGVGRQWRRLRLQRTAAGGGSIPPATGPVTPR